MVRSADKLMKITKALVFMQTVHILQACAVSKKKLGVEEYYREGLGIYWIAGEVLTSSAGGAFVASAAMKAIGFGALGPIAGSIAAGWQASIGAVSAGSVFSTMQSAAMLGGPVIAVGAFIGLGIWGAVSYASAEETAKPALAC